MIYPHQLYILGYFWNGHPLIWGHPNHSYGGYTCYKKERRDYALKNNHVILDVNQTQIAICRTKQFAKGAFHF